MEKLSDLPNIGESVEKQLVEAGISTPDQLRACGSRQAWLRIQQNDPTACLHRLQALEGAVRGVHKADLPPEEKESLRAFFHDHPAGDPPCGN